MDEDIFPDWSDVRKASFPASPYASTQVEESINPLEISQNDTSYSQAIGISMPTIDSEDSRPGYSPAEKTSSIFPSRHHPFESTEYQSETIKNDAFVFDGWMDKDAWEAVSNDNYRTELASELTSPKDIEHGLGVYADNLEATGASDACDALASPEGRGFHDLSYFKSATDATEATGWNLISDATFETSYSALGDGFRQDTYYSQDDESFGQFQDCRSCSDKASLRLGAFKQQLLPPPPKASPSFSSTSNFQKHFQNFTEKPSLGAPFSRSGSNSLIPKKTDALLKTSNLPSSTKLTNEAVDEFSCFAEGMLSIKNEILETPVTAIKPVSVQRVDRISNASGQNTPVISSVDHSFPINPNILASAKPNSVNRSPQYPIAHLLVPKKATPLVPRSDFVSSPESEPRIRQSPVLGSVSHSHPKLPPPPNSHNFSVVKTVSSPVVPLESSTSSTTESSIVSPKKSSSSYVAPLSSLKPLHAISVGAISTSSSRAVSVDSASVDPLNSRSSATSSLPLKPAPSFIPLKPVLAKSPVEKSSHNLSYGSKSTPPSANASILKPIASLRPLKPVHWSPPKS